MKGHQARRRIHEETKPTTSGDRDEPIETRPSQTLQDGSVYTGDWKGQKRHGHGVCKFKDGTDYEGTWENDVYHGEGKLTHSAGHVYTGQFC